MNYKLTKNEWYAGLKEIKEMANRKHEDYEVQLILAKLYGDLCGFYIWQLPKTIYRTWRLEKVKKLHKNCCDLD